MRFPLSALALFASLYDVSAFVAKHTQSAFGVLTVQHVDAVVLGMSDGMGDDAPKQKKTLTAADILARPQKSVGAPELEETPKIFEDELLDDMQSALLKIEKRVAEGPGALSADEVLEFEAETGRIIEEMNAKLAEGSPQVGASSSSASAAASPAGVTAAPDRTMPPSATVALSPLPVTPVAPSSGFSSTEVGTNPSDPTMKVISKKEVTDTSQDEGPAYDGTGGFGLAKGTANTYIIPGMDEMDPEEYRAALQKSVTDRQSGRRQNRSGVVGNRAALQYLDQLGYGGASDNWAPKGGDDSGVTSGSTTAASATGNYSVASSTIPPVPSSSPSSNGGQFVVKPESNLHAVPVSHHVPPEYEQESVREAHEIVDKMLDEPRGDGPELEVVSNKEVTDTSQDEGPAYDGTGGFGLAKGTANTYIIPGMDEMDPEEYRAALQKSVTDRQSRRRQNRSGVVGNRAALQYLDQLGYGGASDNWASKGED